LLTLYLDVVDEGCEVEHGGKRADKGEGQRADGGDAGSVGQRRGEGGCNPCLHLTVCDVFSTILYLFFTGCLIIFRPSVTDFPNFYINLFFTGFLRNICPSVTYFLQLYICSLRIFLASIIRALRPVITVITRVFQSVTFVRVNF
jgi:hypothetical protein